MLNDKLNSILNIIKEISNSKKMLFDSLSELDFEDRENQLKRIYNIIIQNNELINKLIKQSENIGDIKLKKGISPENAFIDMIITEIKENPTKKVFFLNEFLNKFQEISENDKKVLLNTLKNTSVSELKEKMLSLVKIFKLKIN